MFRRFFSLVIILSFCLMLSASCIYQQPEKQSTEPDLVPSVTEDEKVLDSEHLTRINDPPYRDQDVDLQIQEKIAERKKRIFSTMMI